MTASAVFVSGLIIGIIMVLGVKWLGIDMMFEEFDEAPEFVDGYIPILISKQTSNEPNEVLPQPPPPPVGHNMVSSLVNAGILKPRDPNTVVIEKSNAIEGIAPKVMPSSMITANAYRSSVDPDSLTDLNIFLPRIRAVIKSADGFVSFSGRNIKQMFGQTGKVPAVLELTGRLKARDWGDVSSLLKEIVGKQQQAHYWNTTTAADSSSFPKALHIHNEHKIGDFFELMLNKHLKDYGRKSLANRVISESELHSILELSPVPLVVTNSIDENWGFLSTGIGTRTAHWLNMTNHLRIHRSDYSTVHNFLSSNKIALLQASGHVDPVIGYHPKIICMPLGIRNKAEMFDLLDALSKLPPDKISKNKWLTINNSGWGDREKINEMVSIAFNRTVVNSYSGVLNKHLPKRGDRRPKTDQNARIRHRQRRLASVVNEVTSSTPQAVIDKIPKHVMETVRSRYVLCPSGLSMDSYRLWETLVLGSIPVVEANAGMDRIFSRLPVLIVPHYSQLTPELLRQMYPCFVEKLGSWRFEHLTQNHWLGLISEATERATTDHVMEHHPPQHMCQPPLPSVE